MCSSIQPPQASEVYLFDGAGRVLAVMVNQDAQNPDSVHYLGRDVKVGVTDPEANIWNAKERCEELYNQLCLARVVTS